jgi:hypothetical protein
VYVVVNSGLTLTLVPETAPTPPVMNKLVPLLTVQFSELDCPTVIVEGLAVNAVMFGTGSAGFTVTVVRAVTDPEALVAVSV